MENAARMTECLMKWYAVHRRILPWREDPTPYHVWVSEIMLQQTRVEAVKGYYTRFLEAFPDIPSLAAAPEDHYMKLWEGLGYYSRVRNLHRGAAEVLEQFDGRMPGSCSALRQLSGIGPYTAAAIASIAFGERVPAVDGNLLRVFARLTAFSENIKTERARKQASDFYLRWMPEGLAPSAAANASGGAASSVSAKPSFPNHTPGAFNQALMDLGAMVCLPNQLPHCSDCPLQKFCAAHRCGQETAYPVMPEKKARRVEDRTVFLIYDAGRIVIGKRPPKGLLAGLYEFPNAEGVLSEDEALRYVTALGFTALRIRPLPPAKHIFSHIEWHMRGYAILADELTPFESDRLLLVSRQELDAHYSIPSAFSAYRALLPDVQ